MFVFVNILVLRSPSFQVRDGAGYCVFTENVAVICLILANAVFVFAVFFAVVLDFVPSLFSVPMAIKVFLLSDSLKFSSSSPAVCVAPKHCSILEFLKELWHYFY